MAARSLAHSEHPRCRRCRVRYMGGHLTRQEAVGIRPRWPRLTDAVEKVGDELSCLLDLVSAGLIRVSDLALPGARPRRSRHQSMQRNSRPGGLWWRPDEA